MIDDMLLVLTLASALGAGLMAGVFFIFSVAVMGALARLPPPTGISAMQSINAVILSPTFLATFVGTAALSAVLLVAAFFLWSGGGSLYAIAGSLLYIVCSLGVTMLFNVPLNEALAATDAESAEGAALWSRYLSVWTAWNHVRTVGCLAATASFILALR